MAVYRDQAVMDEDGYCRIVGRLTDMVIRGGENIYPTEIEQLLYLHPKIKDVQVLKIRPEADTESTHHLPSPGNQMYRQ